MKYIAFALQTNVSVIEDMTMNHVLHLKKMAFSVMHSIKMCLPHCTLDILVNRDDQNVDPNPSQGLSILMRYLKGKVMLTSGQILEITSAIESTCQGSNTSDVNNVCIRRIHLSHIWNQELEKKKVVQPLVKELRTDNHVIKENTYKDTFQLRKIKIKGSYCGKDSIEKNRHLKNEEKQLVAEQVRGRKPSFDVSYEHVTGSLNKHYIDNICTVNSNIIFGQSTCMEFDKGNIDTMGSIRVDQLFIKNVKAMKEPTDISPGNDCLYTESHLCQYTESHRDNVNTESHRDNLQSHRDNVNIHRDNVNTASHNNVNTHRDIVNTESHMDSVNTEAYRDNINTESPRDIDTESRVLIDNSPALIDTMNSRILVLPDAEDIMETMIGNDMELNDDKLSTAYDLVVPLITHLSSCSQTYCDNMEIATIEPEYMDYDNFCAQDVYETLNLIVAQTIREMNSKFIHVFEDEDSFEVIPPSVEDSFEHMELDAFEQELTFKDNEPVVDLPDIGQFLLP